MTRVDLAVLGGGPAGVQAARLAARRGLDVVLLEREAVLGGAARSFEVAGVRVDLGSHRLHRTTDPALLADLASLLGDDLQWRPRLGRIRLQDRWVPFPLSPAALRRLPVATAARMGIETATGWARRARDDSFAEAIRAGLGPTALRRFYGPYARKLWGLPPEAIDAEQARVRVAASTPGRIVRRVLAGRGPQGFWYPRRGFGQITEVLATDARAAGADLATGTPARALRPVGDGIEVVHDGGALVARTVFSTIPVTALVHLLPEVPGAVDLAARSLTTRAMVLVYAVLDVPRLTRFDAHYLPEPWTPVSRLSEPKNYRNGHPSPSDPGDPVDRTVVCAEIPCEVGDRLWMASREALQGHVEHLLEQGGFPPVVIQDVEVVRQSSVYPVYERGYARRFALVDQYVAGVPDLLTFGRQGLFVHDNTHHALAMATAAVHALDDHGHIDRAAWAAARRRFMEHVVED